MFPSFGWTYLSRRALREAEAQLQRSEEGVRDEIGFLLIHQHFADHFFPGTSVLQTRLRYLFFVSWMYQAMAKGELRRGTAEFETKLAARLKEWVRLNPSETGVIGLRNKKPVMTTRPSAVYWNALTRWGILQTSGLGRMGWEQKFRDSRRRADSELQEGSNVPSLIDWELPPLSLHWLKENGSVSFSLEAPEREYLCRKLRLVLNEDNKPSLLARLVDAPSSVLDAYDCFDKQVQKTAGDDARWLQHAAGASALSGIGRGVYAALVEQLREADGMPDDKTHREALQTTLPGLRKQALSLNLQAMPLETSFSLSPYLRNVLVSTQDWLRDDTSDPSPLLHVYRAAEIHRKRTKACLRPEANDRRANWRLDPALGGAVAAMPLHYRWQTVRRLLKDLSA